MRIVASLTVVACIASVGLAAFAARALAEPRTGSLVVGLVHRNDAPLRQLDRGRTLTSAWTGAVGGWHRLAGRVSLDVRVELFGLTLRARPGTTSSVRAHVGPEVGVVLDPTDGAANGLLRGVRLAAGVDFDATLAGERGDVVVPRLSIAWVDVIPVRADGFPWRPVRLEAGLTWSPGTVLVTLATALESEPL